MTTKLSMIRDINGFNTFGLIQSDQKQNTTLAAGTAQSFTAPTDCTSGYLAIFYYEPGTSIWVSISGTATLPGSSVASTNSEGNPSARYVAPGGTVNMITNETSAEVGVSFYAATSIGLSYAI